MVTPLNRPLRRGVTIDGEPYVVTLAPDGIRLVRKGRRKGMDIPWTDIVSGTLTLDAQLVASLQEPERSFAGSRQQADPQASESNAKRTRSDTPGQRDE